MAKVAKKSASSVKKSGAIKKVVAKKAEKQKKTTVKVTSSTSKKKTESKKSAKPAKKTVVKKTTVKAKLATLKKPVKSTAVKKSAPKAVVKPSKTSSKPVSKVPAKAVTKKPVAVVKEKVSVKTIAKPAKAVDIKKKSKSVEIKASIPPVTAIPLSKTAAKPRRAKKKKDDDDDDEEVVVFRKPAKAAKSTSAKKSASKYISEELTLEGPVPTRVGPIVMSADEKMKLKKTLLHKCIDIQKANVGLAKKAMEDALSSANEEKVTEELSDSFRESMHATRDMYARQAQEGVNSLGLLNRIMVQEHDKVKFGSVVFTNFQNYFISTSLGELKVDDKTFQTVSTLSPLFQILADKRKGDTFMFLDRLYTVLEVF